jgi:hypothetical protein
LHRRTRLNALSTLILCDEKKSTKWLSKVSVES